MAATLVMLGQGWLWIGAAVTVAFLAWGIDRVSPRAHGSYAFRVLLIPGTVLLWPLVLGRWWRLERGVDPCAAHRPPRRLQDGLGLALAVVLPLVLFAALILRTDGPIESQAVQLEAPE